MRFPFSKRFLRLTGIGFCVGTLFTCLVAGGVEDGFLLLVASIVCTAGIGLVVWIPLWWALGWITMAVVERITGRFSAHPATDSSKPAVGRRPPAERSLEQYVKQAEARGVPREKADRLLQKMGWSPGEIKAARLQIAAHQ